MTVSSTLPITSVDKTLPADHSVISQSAPIAIFPELPQQARLLQAAFAQPRRQIGILSS